jgi:2-desacetyl-2-hydroxyethyl bacteriochlorophyllide A dehydrogenase
MRAAVVAGPQRFEVQETEAPEVQPGGVLVRVRNCGICGSDLHFYRGEFPAVPGLRLGHEIAGEVAAVGEGVTGLSIGQPVAVEPVEVCWECNFCRTGRYQLCPDRKLLGHMVPGAFAEYVHVPAYTIHPLPGGVDFEVGALVEPLAVAVHGLRLVGLSVGERVAIIGSGTIGLMALVGARALGASDIFMTARYPHQAEAARGLGADQVVEAGEDAVQELTVAFGGRLPEVVVETVGGHADTLNQAVTLAQPGGRVSILGLFTGPVSLNATVAVLKEVLLLGGITYGRPGTRSDFEVALEIAGRRTEELRRLITHRVALADIGQGFATAADKSQGSIKVTVEV